VTQSPVAPQIACQPPCRAVPVGIQIKVATMQDSDCRCDLPLGAMARPLGFVSAERCFRFEDI